MLFLQAVALLKEIRVVCLLVSFFFFFVRGMICCISGSSLSGVSGLRVFSFHMFSLKSCAFL